MECPDALYTTVTATHSGSLSECNRGQKSKHGLAQSGQLWTARPGRDCAGTGLVESRNILAAPCCTHHHMLITNTHHNKRNYPECIEILVQTDEPHYPNLQAGSSIPVIPIEVKVIAIIKQLKWAELGLLTPSR